MILFKTIYDAIGRYSASTPNKLAIIDKHGEVSYSEYNQIILQYAAYFKSVGVNYDDKVILIAAQDRHYLATFHALQIIGAIPLPMERTTKEDRIKELMELTDAKLCVSHTRYDSLNTIEYQTLNVSTDIFDISKMQITEISDILFTTGTTGKSKGVVMTHSADVAVAENVKYGVEMEENNVEIIPMPLNHSFGLRRYFANMINGSTVILLDGVINMKALFDAAEKYKATAFAMNPTALGILLKMAAKKLASLSHNVKYMQFGSAHLSDSDKDTIKSLLPNSRLYDFYGSTEAGCACIINFNSNDCPSDCIGRPTVNSSFKVLDENGNEMPRGIDNKGRLICTGGMCMKEYFGDPETTAETFIDGYVYSNDLCSMDEEGRIYYFGRADDVINCGGNKISPQEVEDVAMGYSGISDCACVGVADKISGSVPKLFVVPANNYDQGELLNYLTERLEYYMVPKFVEIIDEIPKTFNGKPLRRKLIRKENN